MEQPIVSVQEGDLILKKGLQVTESDLEKIRKVSESFGRRQESFAQENLYYFWYLRFCSGLHHFGDSKLLA